MLKISIMLITSISIFPIPLMAEKSVQSSIVKIYVVCNEPDYANPWNMKGPESFSGSGVVIEGNKILTNAHVVSNQTYLQVRVNGEPDKFEASVLAVSHEADLAVLTVEDPSFFDGIEPVMIGSLPELQEQVVVYGFPLGGDAMSMTAGVVSRIEDQEYVHSNLAFLAIQVDAAINYGNSGGPALSGDGLIVGIAMQGRDDADNIGYLIPTTVIKHFLKDLKDGNYDGVPSLGVKHQTTENKALRQKLSMDDEMSGVLVSRIIPESSAYGHLKVGDVILNIDGFNIANDGTVSFRSQERTSYSYAVEGKQIGESIGVDVLRNGEIQKLSFILKNKIGTDKLLTMEYDKPPTYFIHGGLVFSTLTINYLQCWGDEWYRDAPNSLLSYLFDHNWKTEQEQEIVVLNKVLPIEENVGYHELNNEILASINGQIITCMRDVVQLLEGQLPEYVDIKTVQGTHITLKRDDIPVAKKSVKAKYKIEYDRSEDLM